MGLLYLLPIKPKYTYTSLPKLSLSTGRYFQLDVCTQLLQSVQCVSEQCKQSFTFIEITEYPFKARYTRHVIKTSTTVQANRISDPQPVFPENKFDSHAANSDNAPAHSTALVQAFFFCQTITSPRSVGPLQPIFGSLRLLDFPKAKIAFEREEICEMRRTHSTQYTVHRFGQLET